MGMFDYVRVECPIEGVPNPAAIDWQTKDFDWPFMEQYKITADGRLLHEIVHYEDRSDKALGIGPEPFAGCMTSVHEGWKDLDYHGELGFHGFVNGHTGPLTCVVARFTNGNLESIRVTADV
jgi:hypothetical protein